MRHSIATEIDIASPAPVVWEILTDLDSYPDWNPFIVSAEGVVAVGERLVNRMLPPGGKAMTFKPTITAVEPTTVLEWLGRLGLPGLFDGRHRFELREQANGWTTLVHSEEFRGILVRPMRGSLDSKTKQGFEAMNRALKERCELRARTP